jgi:hypothetical protein
MMEIECVTLMERFQQTGIAENVFFFFFLTQAKRDFTAREKVT